MASPDDTTKYDLALSFWTGNGPKQASELNDRLSSGLNVFYFPRKQEDISGTDGMETMRTAFRNQSRLNVVLFAGEWGETPWTRIERTAIQERCLADGWQTLFFIKLDTAPKPKWLPDTYVYFNWQDYGPGEAAGAIKARVQELGGRIHVETITEKALRLQRARDYEERRENFHRNGIPMAEAAFIELKSAIRKRLDELPGAQYHLKDDPGDGSLIIRGFDNPMKIAWSRVYSNSLEHSELRIETWRGHPAVTNGWTIDSTRIGSSTFMADISPEDLVGWRLSSGEVMGPEAFADFFIGDQLQRSLDKPLKHR